MKIVFVVCAVLSILASILMAICAAMGKIEGVTAFCVLTILFILLRKDAQKVMEK